MSGDRTINTKGLFGAIETIEPGWLKKWEEERGEHIMNEAVVREVVAMTELDKLERYLIKEGYFYERIDKTVPRIMRKHYEENGGYKGQLERHQIIVYRDLESTENKIWFDVICQWGSYGYDNGLLEISGPKELCKNDMVEGWLTAQNIIDRLEGLKK